jgi:hypothetical protein
VTYRNLAVRDATKPLTWSFRAGLAKERRALLLMGSLFVIGGIFGATSTVRFQCHRSPSSVVPACVVTNGPVFFRETRDVAISPSTVLSVERPGIGKSRRTTIRARDEGGERTVATASDDSVAVVGLTERLNAFLRDEHARDFDDDAGPSWMFCAVMLLGAGALVAVLVSALRRVRIVVDTAEDVLLVAVGFTAAGGTPEQFDLDPRGYFAIEANEKGRTFLVYDTPRRSRTRLCEATAGLEPRLAAINEVLAGLPPPGPP